MRLENTDIPFTHTREKSLSCSSRYSYFVYIHGEMTKWETLERHTQPNIMHDSTRTAETS